MLTCYERHKCYVFGAIFQTALFSSHRRFDNKDVTGQSLSRDKEIYLSESGLIVLSSGHTTLNLTITLNLKCINFEYW